MTAKIEDSEFFKKRNFTFYNGNCIEILKSFPDKSVNMIFADPPYNLSGEGFTTVKSGKRVKCDKGEWDKFDDYYSFTFSWIEECKRILTDDGIFWISGTLHSHPTIGVVFKHLDFWIINDIIWFKPNGPPLLSGNRFVPSTELIWLASKSKKYYFDYDQAKVYNNGKQLRNLWEITAKRHITGHPTEKPEELLERIVLIGSREGDVILDPFFGSGTTGVVAKRYRRNFVGIEIDKNFFEMGKRRIELTTVIKLDKNKEKENLTIQKHF